MEPLSTYSGMRPDDSASNSGMRPVHPGEILREELLGLGISATALAADLGVPANRITTILNGQRGVTADTALRLARYFGTTAQFWLNLQVAFDLRTTQTVSGDAISRSVRPASVREEENQIARPSPADTGRSPNSRRPGPFASKSRVAIPKAQLASLCKAHGLRSLAIFGSVLRDDFDSESDIDFLVEFEEGRVPGLLGIAAIEIEISKLLDGRKVDVRTIEDLSRYFRDEVLKDAEILYAQG